LFEEQKMRLHVTGDEVAAGRLHDTTLSCAVEAFHNDGYVILAGVVGDAPLDALKRKLDADTAELLRRGGFDGPDQFVGHLIQSMPRTAEHIHHDIVANPLAVQVTAAILGEGLHLHFYNCNTNMPGSEIQPLHRDAPYLWPDPIHPVISIILNVSPVDVGLENGAIELWPGTHRILGSTRINNAAEEERCALIPPIRAETRKGDVLLRDPRLWHRGVTNLGTQPRHMVAMVHSKWFYRADTAISVTQDAMYAFDDEVLSSRVELVPDDYDYLAEEEGVRGW
jgi:ectoine hydroxylase-related dioxygenase (phytanoyl-CoA dioxygenase family)